MSRPTHHFPPPPPATTTTSHIRAPSLSATHSSTNSSSQQPSFLHSRIASKRTELENLRQLRDLSEGLAGQMQVLQDKLGVLSDGTEAVATVLANWGIVLRAIQMASMKIPKPKPESDAAAEAERDGEGEREGKEVPLPQTLVRIPVREEKESGPLEDGREDGGSRTGA